MLHELEHPCPPTIISKGSLNVCFWHKADVAAVLSDVCFWGGSRHSLNSVRCPLLMLWTAPTLRHQSAKGWLREANHVEGSRPWARLARLVLILRSQCFRCTGLMTRARW